ncbi:MAG: two-component sensor histidine kinase [Bacteroides sp.]|nr:two-component sensor histidine kinase [Bacteroides sp.]MBO5015299.1 two-component sensor histidine kinase [Bacteroidaceae bacterium]
MDTALKPNNRHFLSFSQKLFLTVVSLFMVFAACFIAYQYQREKVYKVELLNMRLQDGNNFLHQVLQNTPDSLRTQALKEYVNRNANLGLRLTMIDRAGNVLFDSYADNAHLSNHSQRPEIVQALIEGKGYNLRRTSETTGEPYFYSATAYPDYVLRSSLPYNLPLQKSLAADPHYLWVTALISLFLIILFYKFTSKLGTAITQLREFAKQADNNEPIDMTPPFPHNELGDISNHIIQIYRRLHQTKEALYIEREKLLLHLQSSREGLGIFTKEKKEILVNSSFTQYGNLISDSNLQTTEEIFNIREFQPLNEFIEKTQRYSSPQKERRMSIDIEKNGHIFFVECIIFYDFSFEISINDFTLEEEQIRMKKQLTQNIAHELKTPVSSIQGYLETIVANKNIPPEKQQLFLERCYAQSNRLAHLLQDISVLTRMDDAKNMIEMERVDIVQLVNSICNDLSDELEEKRITIINKLKPQLQLRGNHSLLYSIFRNLLENAIAYAGTDIDVCISCFREDEKFYYFSFADTGVGVAPEHLNRLFERFYRVDKGRSRKMGGTGLGLAIVKNAVGIHGGNISAKNNPDGGLEFVFTIGKGE